MKKIDFGSDETFIQNYEKLKSSRKMGKIYNCDKNTITKHAQEIGYNYTSNKEKKITNIPINEVIKLYEELQSTNEVGKIYNCSGTAVLNYLKKNGYNPINHRAVFNNVNPEEFIALFQKMKSTKEMAKYYKCSEVSIRNFANKINFDINSIKDYKLSKKDKEFIINAYNSMTSSELAEKFQVSRGMITKIWYDNNLLGKIVDKQKTTEINIIGQKFGYWKVLSKSEKRGLGGCIYYNCICEYDNCGIIKEVLGTSLRQGLSLSCGAHHNISRGNEKIKELLKNANIPFETEKRFKSCKDKTYLPFDFYINNQYLLEYDGIQHFEESIFNFEYVHAHDLIKNEWCKKNDIPLIRIPYTHYKKLSIKDLLLETTEFLI